jgi:hypothetical protein
VGEFGKPKDSRRLVAGLVGNDGNAGDLAAGVELDPDRLRAAAGPILEADRERMQFVHDRPAAVEQQMRPVHRTRHQRLLVLIQNEDFQLLHSKDAPTGLSTLPFRAVSPRQCCRLAFEQNPFRAYR